MFLLLRLGILIILVNVEFQRLFVSNFFLSSVNAVSDDFPSSNIPFKRPWPKNARASAPNHINNGATPVFVNRARSATRRTRARISPLNRQWRIQRVQTIQRAPPGIQPEDELIPQPPAGFIPPVRPPGAPPILPDLGPLPPEFQGETVEETVEEVIEKPHLPPIEETIIITQPEEKKRVSGYSYNKFSPMPPPIPKQQYVPYWSYTPLPPPQVVEEIEIQAPPAPPPPPPPQIIEEIIEIPAKPKHYGGYFG